VDAAAEDRQDLLDQGKKLKGQQANLQQQLSKYDTKMRLAKEKITIVQKDIVKNPEDDDAQGQYQTATSDFTSAQSFIEKVKPISNDIDRLVLFADKAYKKSGYALQAARTEIETEKAAYDAVTAGASAMQKAMKAFTGRSDLNEDAEKAMAYLRNNVSNKIGVIKSAIQVTSNLMSEQDLNDAAKVSLAAKTAEKFDIDKQLPYSETITSSATHLDATKITSGNRYLDLLNGKK
jgi:hypothetical protein